MTALYRHHAQLYADIFPHDGNPIRLGSALKPSPIRGFTYSHSLSGGQGYAAQATLTLRDSPQLKAALRGQGRFDQVVHEDDWIIISGGDSGRRDDVALLLIDKVNTILSLQNGTPITEYLIVCRSFAKAIDMTEVWFCPWGDHANVVGSIFLGDANYMAKGSPDAICTYLLGKFLGATVGPYGAWQMPPGLVAETETFPMVLGTTAEAEAAKAGNSESVSSLAAGSPGIGDILDTRTMVNPTRGEAIFTNIVAESYSLSGILNEYSNPILNELFFDLRLHADGQLVPMMVLRERPWPVFQEDPETSAWNMLPTVTIPLQVVSDTQLAPGVRYNTFVLDMEINPGTQIESKQVYPPLQKADDVRRHGMRKFEVGSRFITFLTGPDAPQEPSRWNYLLHSWYGIDKDLLSGTISLQGMHPDLRVGRKVVLTPTDVQDASRYTFYLEGVQLQWVPPPGGWTTTLNVSRGYQGTDFTVQRFLQKHFDGLTSLDPTVDKNFTGDEFRTMRKTQGLTGSRDWKLQDVTAPGQSATLLGRGMLP